MEEPGHGLSDEIATAAASRGPSITALHRRRRRVLACVIAIYLAFGGVIGSEFLPHLDEGALWVRGTLDQSAGPNEGIRVANQARVLLCSFPEVTDAPARPAAPTTAPTTPASSIPNTSWA